MLKLKKTKVIIICVIVLAIAAAIGAWQLLGTTSPERADLDHLNELHMKSDPGDIPFLIEVVERNPDQYVRERAVFIMTDIAIRKDAVGQVDSFLRSIAYNETIDSVRSAAYTNLYLMKEYNPPSIEGSFNISIEGSIYQGNTVDLVASVGSGNQAGEAKVGIKRVAKRGDAEGAQGIRIFTPNPVDFSLKAGEIKESGFSLELRDQGEYLILCAFELSIDRIDYQTIERQVLLRFDRYGGSYEVQE